VRKDKNVQTFNIKSETADMIRAAAPKLGMMASENREIVAPGVEALHLDAFAAVQFDARRKAAKVSADVMITRILKGI
jgi:hypothetical protein